MISVLCTVLLLSPESEIVDTFGAPIVYEVSMRDYVNQGSSNLAMKMLTSVYIDSLEVELSRSLDLVLEYYSDTPEMQEYVLASHDAFVEYVDSWAMVTEERMWWRDGIRDDGTARGYAWSWTKATWYWQKIVTYNRMASIEDLWGEALETVFSDVGGYRP